MKLHSLPSNLLLLAFLATAGTVFAQTACPVGVPPGDPRCGPSPDWHQGQEQAQQAPPPPPVVVTRWEVFDDRFGAIASSQNGAYGMSKDETSPESAELAALAQCRLRGGEDCKSLGVYANNCATLAWGGGYVYTGGGSNRSLSEQTALRTCEKDVDACKVIETACSTPVSRWVVSDTPPPGFVPKQR